MTALPPLSLYVHFPWCVRKCPYCDFNSHPLRPDTDTGRYVDALMADLSRYLPMIAIRGLESVYFGGGTPSLLDPAPLARILDPVRTHLRAGAELTLEANPGTVEHAPWRGYLDAGINRLSLGAQTFSTRALRVLGRIHGPGDIDRAVQGARRAGFANINLDLMHGLPGQTVDEAVRDLKRALALGPDHVSWYELTVEPRTEFARRPPVLPPEARLAAIESAGFAVLEAAGFDRYEISAFARPGRQGRHNVNYWRFGDYVGIGAGAHGKITGAPGVVHRTGNPPSPRLFQRCPDGGRRQPVTDDLLPGEFMLNALRLVAGVPFHTFEAHTGLEFDPDAPVWRSCVADGLVAADRIAATALGLKHLDTVIQRFL